MVQKEEIYRRHKDRFTLTTDRSTLDLDIVHAYLVRSYWKEGVAKERIARYIQHSLCFILLDNGQQIGFARAVTDHTDFAYLADVFILEAYQGQGLGKWMLSAILEHPDFQELGMFLLATRDAHGFYRQFGFEEIENSQRWMIKPYPRP